jgi:lactoylglutathione lyase
MRFGYTILYVADVAASLEFYERAFDQRRAMLHESGQYGELDTGETTLAFASHELAAANLPQAFRPPIAEETPFEVCFVTDDVAAAHKRALDAGAIPVSEPQRKPWGQEVAYVRDPDGTLIELATPVA